MSIFLHIRYERISISFKQLVGIFKHLVGSSITSGLLFEFLSIWGNSREYARANGSTLLFFGTFTRKLTIITRNFIYDHSVILVVIL